jgi:3-hydroxybutyrate dehydrogenase
MTQMEGELTGRRAVITGGGRGIGAAVAEALVSRGAAVVVSARSTDEIEAVAAGLREQGGQAWAVGCDVSDPEQISALAREASEKMGGVDILVNNAGIARSAPLKSLTLDEWNRILTVNATGVFLCTQAVLPQMVERGWGRVVNIASIAGKMGAPYIAAYSASKHAVIGFTRSVAMEVATTGVTVNAVCPGYVDTPMTEASVSNIVAKTGHPAEAVMKNLRSMSPQNRLMEPEEVAYMVAGLCDERSRGVTGQALVLDGGGVQS